MKINKFENKNELDTLLVQELTEHIMSSLENANTALFLSGGSVSSIYPKLAENLGKRENYKNSLIIGLVDERFSESEDEKNATALKKYFDEKKFNLLIPDSKDTKKDEYSKILNEQHTRKIAVLGIGTDFHTAGIKPPRDMSDSTKAQNFNGDNLVTTYAAEDFPIRFTLTYTALGKIEKIFIYFYNKPELYDFLVNQDIKRNISIDGYLEKNLGSLIRSHQDLQIYCS